jgi:hypothetical protein
MPIDNYCVKTIKGLVNQMDATLNGSFLHPSLQEISPFMDNNEKSDIVSIFNKFLGQDNELNEVIEYCRS